MAALRAMYPGVLVPDPIEVHLTRWGQDPYSMGSYSYVCHPGSMEKAREMLALPWGNVLFSGEATSKG